jgi:hypothetical protein
LHGFGKTDSWNFRQFIDTAPAQSAQRTMPFQKIARDVDCIRAGDPGAEQDRDQFGIGQSGGATGGELFPRPLVFRHFPDTR